MLASLPGTAERQQSMSCDASSQDATLDVVCAADDAYAMPLAVTLKSACRNLAEGYRIRLFLLSGGISDKNFAMIESTLKNESIDINVIEPDLAAVSDLGVSHHISRTAYFRLLTAELIPDGVEKVIYLDSDLFIKENVVYLWDLPLGDQYCLAAVDVACPYIDARAGCRNFRLANPYMASLRPIRNFRSLGLNGCSEYFNSGVMVLNLKQWRRENVAERLLKTLRDNAKYVWCWDQYALNVVFHSNWGRFNPRWNQGAHAFEYPAADHAPIAWEEWTELRTNPAIVHFTTEFKPWQYDSGHPRGEVFFEGLADTAWKDWRPERVSLNFKRWINRRMLGAMKRTTISTRKVASLFVA